MSTNRSDEEWTKLFTEVKSIMPKAVGEDAWYLVIAGIIASSSSPELLGPFYRHLVKSDTSFKNPSARETLSLQLRDVLLKLTVLIGAPRVLSALIPLASTQAELADPSSTPEAQASDSTMSEQWRSSTLDLSAIGARGDHTLKTIYGSYVLGIFDSFGSHKEDFAFVSTSPSKRCTRQGLSLSV